MANYKKLTDVEVMEKVSENTMALVEENGKLKKVPCGAGFGGGNGVATAIVKGNLYMRKFNNNTAPIATYSVKGESFFCDNMTFEEAKEIIISGEPLDVIMMGKNAYGQYIIAHPNIQIQGLDYPIPYIELQISYYLDNVSEEYRGMNVYWTAEGFDPYKPSVPA